MIRTSRHVYNLDALSVLQWEKCGNILLEIGNTKCRHRYWAQIRKNLLLSLLGKKREIKRYECDVDLSHIVGTGESFAYCVDRIVLRSLAS